MFLPVILHRDFGPASFPVFLLPNVIGAAAMGWALARPGLSESMVDRHRPAMTAFSIVTVVFHLVFLVMVVAPLARLGGEPWAGLVLLAASVLMAALGPERAWTLLAYAVSLACLGLWAARGGAGSIPDRDLLNQAMVASALPPTHLAAIACVCVLGFALCPYLDLTFHKARQRQQADAARLSFSVGFGLFFAVMVVFTAGYAALFFETYRLGGVLPRADLVRIVVTHMGVQSAVTVALHLRAVGWHGPRRDAGRLTARLLGAVLVAAAAGSAASSLGPDLPMGLAPPNGDTYAWYRLFMSFYGLVFPAYVWLVLMPTWSRGTPTRRHWGVLGMALACAASCYWLGFMEGRTLWLIPGVAAVLLSRGMIPRGGAGPDWPSDAPARFPKRPPTLARSASAPRS